MIYVQFPDPSTNMNTLLSIGRFGRLPETAGMVAWLKSELIRLDTANRVELDGNIIRQQQGACQALADILGLVEQADNKAEQIRVNISKRKGV